ncbi:HlyD family type I secretion periplasmic adaptor subunit (plasmid) [Rhizobium indicum]|uniref:HlyD family type I secretion periplasmic adaptor subunit n=1 Tax=Rhizobium indicum TaxID=2583231 RepID=UPI0011060B5F|nr:HlyD family type I secretion periplasmic adaptor subunit [Rhizobium indicum]QKK33129.1 HlyD family type I secretion periplasmic adaptor subunit [Rhizobium indicum]
MKHDHAPLAESAIRRLTLFALAAIVLLVGALGGLAATVRLQGAVIAAGTLVVDSYVKPVLHQQGGTVGEVFVKNGDRVQAGQMLVHLDDTQTRANLAIVPKRLKELAARTARLSAERDSSEMIVFPEKLLKERGVVEVAAMLDEQRLFNDPRSWPLLDQGIIPATRVYALQRDAADLTGGLGSLIASAAQTNGKIAETQLQIIQVDDDQRTEVSDQLRQAESEIGEYSERLVAAEDELRHIDIRAPQAGVIHQLAVHAPGAVVTPGEVIMQIVPDTDALTPEVKLSPQDIDQVVVGQQVTLRFSTFTERTTPELNGRVTKIAADLATDQRTGQSYYSLRVFVLETEWARLGNLTPVARMPVEAFVQTGERTALAYLVKPLTDQVAPAFTEE